MWSDQLGAFIHSFAPHSGAALYLSSVICAAAALIFVVVRARRAGPGKVLPENWVVPVAASAAPVPTYILLVLVPLDHDLARTMLNDPVVVALAGLYGAVATARDLKRMTARARAVQPTAQANEAGVSSDGE